MSLPRIGLIGCGSSGIAGLVTLSQAGLDVTAYEKGDRVGGNWVFRNVNGMSAAYRNLHINTSRDRMSYAGFPMPADYPDFPHHSQIAAYFDSYVDHFGVRDKIRFGTGVEQVTRDDAGLWSVRDQHGTTETYDAVVIANGHHWDPRWPEPAFPGSDSFTGEQMHSHSYEDPEAFRGKTVVVLGMGNSAMDIASETSMVAEKVYLAARRGAWVIPKYIGGKPLDALASPAVTRQIAKLPFKVRQKLMTGTFLKATGSMESYGLPKPDHGFAEAHPTISDSILSRITHGKVVPKPTVARLDGGSVVFADGSSVEADVVVYATGYRVSFPFFDPGFIAAPGNDLPLFRRVFHPSIGGVYFLSLLQPLGATMPLAEAQGQWLAEYLTGGYALPPVADMLADMAAEREEMFARYVNSPRHTMQIDFDVYMWQLAKERKAGRKRAAAAGAALPVPARAQQTVGV